MRPGRGTYKRELPVHRPAEDRSSAEMSPAERIVESAAPRDLSSVAQIDVDSEGNAIRPWEPKGLPGLGAPPGVTVEGVALEFSVDPPLTAGGSPPAVKTPFARWSQDE